MGLAGALGLIVVLTLLVLIIGKDLATAAREDDRPRWSASLNVAIAPLAIAFVVMAAVKIADVLS